MPSNFAPSLYQIAHRLRQHPDVARVVRAAANRIWQLEKELAVSKETTIISNLLAQNAAKDQTIAGLNAQVASLQAEPKKDADDVATEAKFDDQGNLIPPAAPTPPAAQ